MVVKIITEPNPILRQKAELIALADLNTASLQNLIKNLVETMYQKDGVGMAAPQIGESIRLCVITKKYNPLDKKKDLILINPCWEKISIFKSWDEEGCLSVPLTYGKVRRYRKIKVKAWDEEGKVLNFTADDFFARIIQHEIDHLEGILFIDKAKNLHEVQPEL